MGNKNVFLIGFMGCGKSTMARFLASDLGRNLIEMDEQIEKEAGMTINEIFKEKGEEYFRDLESQLVKRISNSDGVIVSCGGGAVLREENVKTMKENGMIVYLSATPETIYKRVKDSTKRPLLNGNMKVEYIKELMEKRTLIYERAADKTICVDGKGKQEVVNLLKKMHLAVVLN